MFRKTYVEINLKNIESNIKTIINKFNTYKYYFAVIKADAYGHGSVNVVQSMINAGCNYLAVATLEEALEIREKYEDIPILCFGIIDEEYIEICVKNNITVSVGSLDYINEIKDCNIKDLKIHIQINTGMNRFGITDAEELKQMINQAKDSNMILEGIYTHIYNAPNKEDYKNQVNKFKNILEQIDYKEIPIIHLSSSEALAMYKKPDFVNGCRLGIIMYGFSADKTLILNSTFTLYSEVIKINHLKKGETVRI